MARENGVWEVQERDFDFEATMARTLRIHPAVAAVLRARGVESIEAARQFLKPSLAALHDPFALPDMEAAATRLVRAVGARETVVVHGDYDVDGVTGAALMVHMLSKLGVHVWYHIPHRQFDHYGLSVEAVRQAARQGASLVIAVDCGVTAHEAVDEARRLGLDVVVIDHHEPAEQLPRAMAVVDPKRDISRYPERDLASVGLCFKVATAVCRKMDLPEDALQRAYLDLVALGTIADVVPLTGENRVLTHFGLKQLAQTRKVGLQALMRLCGLDGAVRSSDVAFRLGPRMNAAGRMGDATDTLELLLTNDEIQAQRLALVLDNANRERQREQEATYQEALRMFEEQVDLERDRVVVLVAPGWHLGVVGIVASKMLERHGRPTVLLVEEGEHARGSARSIQQFDISRALEECSDTLVRFGGHALAAGLTVRMEQVDELRVRLNRLAEKALTPEMLKPRLRIDAELLLDEIDTELLEGLEALEPHGQGNPEPLFTTRGVDVLDVRCVGKDDQHLKLLVSQGDRLVDCIGFGLGREAQWVRRGMMLDLCHTPEINEYAGIRGIQLRVEALKPTGKG